MSPGTHHDTVVHLRIVFFQLAVNVQGTIQVLSVEQATDHKHVGSDIFQVRKNRAALPKLVVVGVLGNFLPKEIVVAEILARVSEGSEVHIKLPAVAGGR